MKTAVLIVLAVFCFELSTAQNYTVDEDGWVSTEGSQIYFNVANLTKMKDKTEVEVEWQTTLPGAHHAEYDVADDYVFNVHNITFEAYPDGSNITASGKFNISNTFLGYNNLTLTIYDANNQTLESKWLVATVLIGYPFINRVFLVVLGIMIFIVYINMGATLDLTVVKKIVKRPIGPLVGLCCQYTIMPVVSFGLAKAFFPDNPLLQLGMFLNGASPGGGQSNIWTYLLGGSLDLSIAMTFTSTVAAFVFVPIWVLSLGPVIFRGTPFVIPYGRIALLVVMLVIPCAIGIGIQFFRPKWSKFLAKHVLKKVAITNMIFIITFGFYANRYIFKIFTWKILLACILMPVCGYLSGLIIAKLAKRSTPEIISISIETGVQNANIAIFILKSSLPQPAGDLTVVIPAAVVILTPLPLACVYFIKRLYQKYGKSETEEITKPGQAEVKDGKDNPTFDASSEQNLEKYEPNYGFNNELSITRSPNGAYPGAPNLPSVEINGQPTHESHDNTSSGNRGTDGRNDV